MMALRLSARICRACTRSLRSGSSSRQHSIRSSTSSSSSRMISSCRRSSGGPRLPSRNSTAFYESLNMSQRRHSPLQMRFASSNGNDVAENIPIKQMSENEYDRLSEEDMETLHENLEILCEQYAPGEWEVEYSSGVMTVHIPPHGTYVINKQPPNQQIWMSSPFSGPARFGYSPEGVWVHHRLDGVSLGKLLEEELRRTLESDGEGWEGVGLR